MPYPSTQMRAQQYSTSHRFIRGTGYVEFGSSEALPLGPLSAYAAYPPRPVVDGSQHALQSPRNGLHVFTWREQGAVWLPRDQTRSHRLGFTADYLGSHGWRYVGPYPLAAKE